MSADGRSTPERFDEIDWSDRRRRRVRPSPAAAVLAAGLAAVAAFYCYDVYLVGDGPTVAGWDVSRVDWLSLVAAAVVAAALVGPLASDRSAVRDLWSRYPRDAPSLAALAFAALFLLVGVFGPVLMPAPEPDFEQVSQPPAGVSYEKGRYETCPGPARDGRCYGTLEHPLGTTRSGVDILTWVVYGTRTALQFVLVVVAFMTPVALAVGTVAAYYGDWIDGLLMGYADVQQSVPTVVVYFLFVFVFGPTLFWLIVAYALFNWDDAARLVRSEALSEAENGYVLAAESAGGSSLHVVREHLAPNVSPALLTAATLQIPRLIVIEATFSFLGLGGEGSHSWGQLLQRGLTLSTGRSIQSGLGIDTLHTAWWLVVVPVVVIAGSVLLSSLFGDALRAALDPR